MKKIVILGLSLIVLFGCSAKQETKETIIHVLAPKGAPALAMLEYAKVNGEAINFVDGSELLQATFLNPNPEYSVILAPTNLGVKLASDGKTNFKLAAVVTWGNLYIVSRNENALKEVGVMGAFGESSVPGLLLESVKGDITPEIIYYNSVVDVQAALLSGKIDVALLAEPVATATLAKSNESLKIIGDLQEMVQNQLGGYGYPQAGIFVLDSFYAENTKAVDSFLEQIQTSITQQTPENLISLIEEVGAEKVGVPNAQIASKTWDRMNIQYRPAAEVAKELTDFLKIFNIEVTENVYLR